MVSKTARLLIPFVAILFMVSNVLPVRAAPPVRWTANVHVPTGATKYMNGHQWAEFLHSTGTDDHKFWVQCD